MALVPLSYNVRSLLVRRSATILTVLGIGATVTLLAGVLALQQGFETLFTASGRDDLVVMLRKGASSEGESAVSDIEGNSAPYCDGWEHWQPSEDLEPPVLSTGWDDLSSST